MFWNGFFSSWVFVCAILILEIMSTLYSIFVVYWSGNWDEFRFFYFRGLHPPKTHRLVGGLSFHTPNGDPTLRPRMVLDWIWIALKISWTKNFVSEHYASFGTMKLFFQRNKSKLKERPRQRPPAPFWSIFVMQVSTELPKKSFFQVGAPPPFFERVIYAPGLCINRNCL